MILGYFRIALTLALFLCSGFAKGQDTWDRYKTRTLGEIVQQHSNTETLKGSDAFFTGDEFPSQVRVTYTGSSRKMSPARLEHITRWIKTTGRSPEIGKVFQTELLFLEGSVEYWLPVQSQVIPFFAKELKKGDRVTLYTIWIGGYKCAGKWDWIFLVNEFEE